MDEQGRDAQALRRRGRRAELAEGRDDGTLAVPPPETAVAARDEVLLRLLLDERARCGCASLHARLDRLLLRAEDAVAPLVLGHVEAHVGEELDRRVEEDRALDPLRRE